MQFNWQGKSITLQGITTPSIGAVSSNQLKRLQDTKSIAAFYHFELSNVSANPTSPILSPSIISPLL